jgi:hypothetical protein
MFNENGHVFSIFPEGNGVPKLTSFFRNQRPLELMAHLLLSDVIESGFNFAHFFRVPSGRTMKRKTSFYQNRGNSTLFFPPDRSMAPLPYIKIITKERQTILFLATKFISKPVIPLVKIPR